MAQFLKAKFLSDALKWKADSRHAADKYFAGLKYDPFIFQQARLTFPSYDKRYPVPANKEFAENFARDLANPTRNKELLRIINPEILTPELEAANQQFETAARLEQQQVAQATGQPPVQPFSLSAPPRPMQPRIIPTVVTPPVTKEEAAAKTPTEVPAAQPPPASTQLPPLPQQIFNANRSGIVARMRNIQPPNWLKNLGSSTRIFARKNLGRIFDGLRGIIGGIGRGVGGAVSTGLGATAPSLGRAFHGGLNAVGRITQPGGVDGIPSGGLVKSPVGKRGAIALLLAMFLFVFISGFLGGLTEPTSSLKAASLPSGGGDISSCKFTRSGNSQLIKSSILSGWISGVAASAGIPPAALASIAMHENPNFTTNADNNHDAITSNQFCNKGVMFCEDGQGHVLHTKADDGINDPCTPAEIATGNRTAQAVGLMQILDIYNPGKDLCSITENLAIAAAKLKASGMTVQPTQDQVNASISGYYNGCTYGNYNYCNEVWQDLQNCQVQPGIPPVGGDFASQLVDKIKKSLACNGFVTIFNHDACIASIQPIPQLSAQAIHNSVFNVTGNVLQCVGFAQAIATDLIGTTGNAINYISNNIPGYRFIIRENNQIQVGDLPVWSATTDRRYGHIAYVTSVQNNGTFQVAEANFCPQDCGKVDLRIDSVNDDQIVGWLRKR
ncbi:MAG: CHAP domain-containing protein [Candidatus Daviesbacteria bacterium]|nr:CHAP domain-containing protein [Candidatus Daviesbacteria bacterium]